MKCMEIRGGRGEGLSYYERPGLDVWVLSYAKQDVKTCGGELHLISSCASGRITRLLMADICGFGPLFNQLATRMRQVVKQNANTIKQARSVRQMSENLAKAAEHGGFASTLVSTYFAPTRSFTVCNTGHPPPMLYRRDTGDWSLLKQPGRLKTEADETPGLLSTSEYQQFKTSLNAGDMVLCCSNNLTETRSRTGQTIGLSALLGRLQQLEYDFPGDIPQLLVNDLVNQQAENLNDVDTTIVLCQATETGVDWRDNVLAPFRLLRSATDRTSFT